MGTTTARLLVRFFDPEGIKDFLTTHPCVWDNRELTRLGGLADQAGMTPTPVVYEFHNWVASCGRLPSQQEFTEFCFDQWDGWPSTPYIGAVQAKIGRNFYPSLIDTYHAFGLVAKAGWYQQCSMDSVDDVVGKADLTFTGDGYRQYFSGAASSGNARTLPARIGGKCMTQTLAKPKPQSLTVEQALVQGDLSGLDSEQRINYYLKLCASLNLNPLSKPFDYIVLNSKLVLYAKKDATDQLRSLHKVSITRLEREQIGDLLVVTATASTPDGRRDSAIGAVNVKGLAGEALANALMKSETKAKRRVTLSLCGLGMTDESEVDSIPGAYYPEAEALPVPTREREVVDADMVRSADDRIWKRYRELIDQAHALGLNPVVAKLPIARDELKLRGTELVDAIEAKQEQLDNQEAARIAAQAHAAAEHRDEDLDAIEEARQLRSGELV